MNNTYDYVISLGHLASNTLEGGHRLDKSDLQRLLSPGKKDAEITGLSEGQIWRDALPWLRVDEVRT